MPRTKRDIDARIVIHWGDETFVIQHKAPLALSSNPAKWQENIREIFAKEGEFVIERLAPNLQPLITEEAAKAS